jgi:hypothetical protein
MGATTFSVKERGTSMRDAYSSAVADAREEYGSDAYNGTISTTNGVTDKTSAFKASGKSLNEFINDNIDNAQKWGNCFGVCIKEPKANTNKVKSQVTNQPFKGTRKWELVYVVTEGFDCNEIGVKDNKADAIKIAREYTEKHQKRTRVHIERRLKGSNAQVAEITYKSSTNESEGEYVFFGWAAC